MSRLRGCINSHQYEWITRACIEDSSNSHHRHHHHHHHHHRGNGLPGSRGAPAGQRDKTPCRTSSCRMLGDSKGTYVGGLTKVMVVSVE